MKKILLLLLLFIPLFACGGASDSTTTEDSSQLPFLRYKKESGGMTILGLDGDYPSDIVIPSSIKGVTVKRINKSAFSESKIESISIPNTIEEIGTDLFRNCTNLKKIIIPSYVSLDDIFGDYLCPNLEELVFQDGSTTLYNGFYDKMTNITKLTLPHSITTVEEGSVSGFSGVKELTMSGHLSFYNNFYNTALKPTKVNILEKSLYICDYSFYKSDILSFYIPKSVEVIYRYAFSNAKFQNIEFENESNLKSIQAYSFMDCQANSLSFPSSVTHIGKYAFYQANFESFIIPEGVTKIMAYTFAESNIKSITIPKTILEIEELAFDNCASLTEISFLGLPKMDKAIFRDCNNLQSIKCYFEETNSIYKGFEGYLDFVVWN